MWDHGDSQFSPLKFLNILGKTETKYQDHIAEQARKPSDRGSALIPFVTTRPEDLACYIACPRAHRAPRVHWSTQKSIDVNAQ